MDQQEEVRQGISLFKIDYEIQGQDSIWSAGIVAYSSEEAVKSLAGFLKDTIKDFKGFKIDTLSFQGAVHHLSDAVRSAIIGPLSKKPRKKKDVEKNEAKKKSILKKDDEKK